MALSDEFLFVLPRHGAPYFHVWLKRDDAMAFPLLREAVGGSIEAIHDLVIEPSFVACCPRWECVAEMLKRPTTKVYGNAEGGEAGRKNLHARIGTVMVAAAHGMDVRRCEKFYYEDLVVVINRKTFNDLGLILDCFIRTDKVDTNGLPIYRQPVFMTELN